MGEKTSKERFKRGDSKSDQGSCYFGILDTHHRVVSPAAVGGPLAFCDEPDSDTGNDNDPMAC